MSSSKAQVVSRYCPRVYKKQGGTAIEAKLIGNERALSTEMPKPNVVRIEVLPSYVRRGFLGGYYATGDEVKTQLMNAGINKNSYLPFYGIAAGDMSAPSFSVDAQWTPSKKQGFSHMMGVLGHGAGIISSTAESGIEKANSFIHGAEKLANTWLGIDNISTGTSTIKTLGGVSMNISVPIKVTWYMPEQSRMCRIGIERLMNIAYVHGLGNDYVTAQSKLFSEAAGQTADKAEQLLKIENPESDVSYLMNAVTSWGGESMKSLLSEDNVYKALDAIKYLNELFGGNMTMNPLPVRVSIGHVINLEPMVITNVTINCSNEQFIADDGSHIPITVTASISVTPWMNPGPDKQFFSFIGDEVFCSNNSGV